MFIISKFSYLCVIHCKTCSYHLNDWPVDCCVHTGDVIGSVDSKFAYTHFKYVKKWSNEKFLDIRELDENFLTYYKIPRSASSLWYKMCTSDFWQTWLHILMDKKKLTHCKHVPCSTLTHSTNEDLLNIKRKGDPKSRTLCPTSDTTDLAISRSSSASKSVQIFWAEIYRGQLFLRAESSLIQSRCRSLRNLKS
jgi:hypothetical protein